MANTYTLISSVTVGSGGAANIEFTSIPSTYTDLQLVYSFRDTRPAEIAWQTDLTFNNVGGTSYAVMVLRGQGTSASSFSVSSQSSDIYNLAVSALSTSNTFNNGSIYIPNYTSSNNKSYSTDTVTENNATTAYATLMAGLFSNSSAISSIKIAANGIYSFVQYSTAYLYGISNA